MNITPVQNSNKASFGSVNLIQVSKTAFKHPDDLNLAYKEFNTAVNTTTGEVNDLIGTIFNLIGMGKKTNKTITYLEQSPAYFLLGKEMKKSGYTKVSWMSKETGIPIAEPLSPDHHSFTILTKEQKDKASPFASAVNRILQYKRIIDETVAITKQGKGHIVDSMWTTAKINQLATEQMRPVLRGQPVNKFVIDDLSQLPTVFEKIEY